MDRTRLDQMEFEIGPQRLMAQIKRRSKYWGQTPPGYWFEIRIANDPYPIRGNNNQYRISDVALGVRMPDESIFAIKN